MKTPITPIEYAFVATVGIGAIMGMMAWVKMIDKAKLNYKNAYSNLGKENRL